MDKGNINYFKNCTIMESGAKVTNNNITINTPMSGKDLKEFLKEEDFDMDEVERDVDEALEEVNAEEMTSAIPTVLDTPEARELWEICQEEGWVDEELQPKMSETHAAILASVIAGVLGLMPCWKPFEELWGIPRLAKKYSDSKDRSYYGDEQKKYRKYLE